MRLRLASGLVISFAVTLSLLACDKFKSNEAPDAASVPTASTPTASASATPPIDSHAIPAAPGELPPGTPPPPPGTKVVRLPDGGLALVNDAGALVADAGRWPGFAVPSGFTVPTALPSGLPTAAPSGFALPSGLPAIPSGFAIPPIPGMPSAKK